MDLKWIRSKAEKNIEILGYQPNNIMQEHMKNAKAFVFAAEEDFGITPVEAQACGTPVIAFGKGGVLETINSIDNIKPTGIFFDEQNPKSIIESVKKFESLQGIFEPVECRRNAEKFSEERFRNEINAYVRDKWAIFNNSK